MNPDFFDNILLFYSWQCTSIWLSSDISIGVENSLVSSAKDITWTYIEIHFTMDSLNADIMRYTADDLNWTLKLWCKLDENVSQYFSVSLSDISSFHPTKHSLSSGQCINACDSVKAFKAHCVVSRERLPQTRDSTDTVRSAPMLRNHSISAGLANVLGLVSNIICFHFV